MASSLEEADAMKEACTRNGVAFNMGTLRRYHPGFEKVQELVLGGSLGAPRALIHPVGGSLLLHTGSHCFDTVLFLLGDPEVESVQAQLGTFIHANGTASGADYDAVANRFRGKNLWESDPAVRHAFVQFTGGVHAHVIMAPGRYDFQVFCEKGYVGVYQDGERWELGVHGKDRDFAHPPFPAFPKKSPTVRCIEDLIGAIESGSLGHMEVSHRGMEIAIAAAQSHIEDGRRIRPPVTNRALFVPNH
jgi:predicted dehydrogenase